VPLLLSLLLLTPGSFIQGNGFKKGRLIQNTGITPDKEVSISLADLQQGRDPQLEAAHQHLRELLQQADGGN